MKVTLIKLQGTQTWEREFEKLAEDSKAVGCLLILEQDNWIRVWVEGEATYDYNLFECKKFLPVLEELIRLANLAEGEPDPALEVMQKFQVALNELLAYPVTVTVKEDKSQSHVPDLTPGTVKDDQPLEYSDDIPF